jgi:hypothetical protein
VDTYKSTKKVLSICCFLGLTLPAFGSAVSHVNLSAGFLPNSGMTIGGCSGNSCSWFGPGSAMANVTGTATAIDGSVAESYHAFAVGGRLSLGLSMDASFTETFILPSPDYQFVQFTFVGFVQDLDSPRTPSLSLSLDGATIPLQFSSGKSPILALDGESQMTFGLSSSVAFSQNFGGGFDPEVHSFNSSMAIQGMQFFDANGSPIPEPSGLILTMLGLGLVTARRKLSGLPRCRQPRPSRLR